MELTVTAFLHRTNGTNDNGMVSDNSGNDRQKGEIACDE